MKNKYCEIKGTEYIAKLIFGGLALWPKYARYCHRKRLIMGVLYGRLEQEERLRGFLLDQISMGLLSGVAGVLLSIAWSIQEGITLESVLLFALAPGFVYLKVLELNKLMQLNDKKVREAYPDFLMKLILLVNAGMTTLGALKKIQSDHSQKESPLYRYLTFALMDIQNGLSEEKGIEQFGKYCRIPELNRFAMVYIQAIRKGGMKTAEYFQSQLDEALKTRKRLVIEKGEEASTQLLLPMGIQLIIILALVMIPAFASIAI